MLRDRLARFLSDPFRGDRPIWLTLALAAPCTLAVAAYEYQTARSRPALVFDQVLAFVAAGLLLAIVLLAAGAAASWALKCVARYRLTRDADLIDDTTPDADLGIAA